MQNNSSKKPISDAKKYRKVKIYNLLKPKGDEPKNFNILPFVSFYYIEKNFCFLNVGWLNWCVQFCLFIS